MEQLVKRWSELEYQYITDHYLEMSDEELAKNLPGRTASSVKNVRGKLKLYRKQKHHIAKNKSTNKIVFDDVKQLFESRKYELISTEADYKNKSTKLSYICPKHRDKGILQITYNNLNQGQGCWYCGRERTNKAKLSILTPEDDRKICEERGLEYIGTEKDEYIFNISYICPKHKEFGIQKARRWNLNRKSSYGCPYCAGKNFPSWYLSKKILEKFPDYSIVTQPTKMGKEFLGYCNLHKEEFKTTPKFLLNNNAYGCKKCAQEAVTRKQMLPPDEVVRRVTMTNPNLIVVDPNSYINYNAPLELKCKECDHIWSSPLASILANQITCPNCHPKLSQGEFMVSKLLNKMNVNYQTQYTFSSCKYKRELPFDFAVFNESGKLCGLIEYQGEQHFKPIPFFGGEVRFHEQELRDEIKKDFCQKNNIPLLTISFEQYDNLLDILNSFIQEIM